MKNMMKANDGKGNIEARDEWETPQWLFDILHKQYNFNIDLCASNSNTKCNSFFDKNLLFENQVNFFKSKLDRCWMNPPFSKALEMFKHFFKVIGKGVAIYRYDNFETKIWQEVIFPNASWVFIPNKRIAYEGMDGKGSRFPSALIGFNVSTPNFVEGTILKVERK